MHMRPVVLPIAFLAITVASYPEHSLRWVGSWACSQQIPEPNNALSSDDLRNATLRQVVHLSIGGSAIRVHISNAFGIAPLHLISVHVARSLSAGSAKIDPATDRAVTFEGRGDVVIPPGARFISDPSKFAAQPGTDLTISIHYDDAPQPETGHPGSRATSYLARGDFVSATDLPRAKEIDHWYQIAGVDVLTGADAFSVVALGDSITDGHGATTNGNDRWTDALARRFVAAGMQDVGVLNEGIGGNHLLTDGLGPNALARFDRDVLAQTGVRYVIVLEGVNDLGGLARTIEASAAEHAELVRRVIAAYEQMITRAHAANICMFGGTILPYEGSTYYRPDEASEADRDAVNAWIRSPGHFDGIVDFDQAARDPAHFERLLPAFDSGDHLHPSPAGYAAMAKAVELKMFGGRSCE